MKGKKMTIHLDPLDAYKHTRSPFATIKISGAGAMKSIKDYDRKRQRREDKKVFDDYKNK